MFPVKYKGKRIEATRSATEELIKHRKNLFDVKKILEEGYDAPRKRKPGTIEKWLDKGNKTYNAVIARSYNEVLKEETWVLIHLGRFTR